MRGTIPPIRGRQPGGISPGLLVCALCFTLGVVLGSFAACGVEKSVLSDYLEGYRSAVESGALQQSLPQLLWKCIRGPLAACMLGFAAFGLAGIPVLFWGKGFLLAYGVTAFLRSEGMEGLQPAFLALGLPALPALPALLLTGAQSWRTAGLRLTRPALKYKLYDRAYCVTCCLSGLLVTGQLLVERYGVLPLLQWAMASK